MPDKSANKKAQYVNIATIYIVSSQMSNNSQNGGLEDYNNISDGIFPHFTTILLLLC